MRLKSSSITEPPPSKQTVDDVKKEVINLLENLSLLLLTQSVAEGSRLWGHELLDWHWVNVHVLSC